MSRLRIRIAIATGIVAMLGMLPAGAAGGPGDPTLVISLDPGRAVTDVAIAPDGQTLVYVADSIVSDRFDLFSVPVTGGTPTRLNGSMVTGGDVWSLAVSRDSAWVVFEADANEDGVRQLFSVPISGGPVATIAEDPSPPGRQYEVLGDPAVVVYAADDADGVPDLYQQPVAGGAATKIADERNFISSPDESMVLAGNQLIPLDGGSPTVLPDAIGELAFTPDSTALISRVDRPNPIDGSDLFNVPLDGSPRVQLSDRTLPGEDTQFPWLLSPNSSHVIYAANDGTQGQPFELYSVPVTGGPSTRLGGPLTVHGLVLDGSRPWPFRISEDSTTAVYVGTDNGVPEIFSAPLGGGPATRLNSSLPGGGEVDRLAFAISPDSAYVVYRASQEAADIFPVCQGGLRHLRYRFF